MGVNEVGVNEVGVGVVDFGVGFLVKERVVEWCLRGVLVLVLIEK